MRRYTDYLSNALAKELQAKGMDVELVDDSVEERPYEHPFHCETIIAEALDWLHDRNVVAEVRDNSFCDEFGWESRFQGHVYRENSIPLPPSKQPSREFETWNEAMEDAIRHALNIF